MSRVNQKAEIYMTYLGGVIRQRLYIILILCIIGKVRSPVVKGDVIRVVIFDVLVRVVVAISGELKLI